MLEGLIVTIRGALEPSNLTWNLARTMREFRGERSTSRLVRSEEVVRAADLDLVLWPAPEEVDLSEDHLLEARDVTAHEGVGAVRPERVERVLARLGEELLVAEEMEPEHPPVEILLALRAGVHPELTQGRVVDDDIALLGAVVDRSRLAPFQAGLPPIGIAVADPEPQLSRLGVEVDPGTTPPALLLEPVVEVALKLPQHLLGRAFRRVLRLALGLVVLEGASVRQVLLAVPLLQQRRGLKPGAECDVRGGRIRGAVERDAGLLGRIEEVVHPLLGRHLVYEEEGVDEPVRRVGVRRHEDLCQPIGVDLPGAAVGGWKRHAARREEVSVGIKESQQEPAARSCGGFPAG